VHKSTSYDEKMANDAMFKSIVEEAMSSVLLRAINPDYEDRPQVIELRGVDNEVWVRLDQITEVENIRCWLREHLEAAYRGGWTMRESTLPTVQAQALASALGEAKTTWHDLLSKVTELVTENIRLRSENDTLKKANEALEKMGDAEFMRGARSGVLGASGILKQILADKKKEMAELLQRAEELENLLKSAKVQSKELFSETLLLSEVLEELEKESVCLSPPAKEVAEG
jgi:regulator of replication initiation timing